MHDVCGSAISVVGKILNGRLMRTSKNYSCRRSETGDNLNNDLRRRRRLKIDSAAEAV